jgi:hypothetical protein
MTEQEWESGPEKPEPTPRESWVEAGDPRTEDRTSSDSPTTGVLAVDAALAEVEGVEALPLEDQLAAFERAQDRLRSALDSEPGDPA